MSSAAMCIHSDREYIHKRPFVCPETSYYDSFSALVVFVTHLT